jgi:hypothetical protein
VAVLLTPFCSNKPAPTQGPQLPLPSTIRQNSEHDKSNLKRKLQGTADGGCIYLEWVALLSGSDIKFISYIC